MIRNGKQNDKAKQTQSEQAQAHKRVDGVGSQERFFEKSEKEDV